jgi:SAM-dependent methyltransferase
LPATNDTSAFYDAIAEHYPLFYRDWETQMEREGLGLRSIFRNRGIIHVVDASCGAGAQAVPLAQLGFRVTAVDPSAGMLRKAQSIADARGVSDHITFLRGDFIDLLELGIEPADAIVSKGNSLPHLLLDTEIETALLNFYELLRPGGTLVIGMRDFGPFMEDRPRFLPGAIVSSEHDEFITFDVWEWHDGPPVIATQNLFIVQGVSDRYSAIKRRVLYRPLSTDEVKVVLLEVGFEEITDQADRAERVLVARKPLAMRQTPLWLSRRRPR